MESIVSLISNVGFPVAIATYTIVIMNKTLQEHNEILAKLIEKFDIFDQLNLKQ